MSLNLDPRQCAMLAEMGVRVWWPTEPVAPASEAATVAPPPNARPAPDTVRQPALHRGAALMPGPVALLPLP